MLPVEGQLDIEVARRGATLTSLAFALIAPGEPHSQQSAGANRSLVVDVPVVAIPGTVLQRPWPDRFFRATTDMLRLVEFAELRARNAALVPEEQSALALLLLLGAVAPQDQPPLVGDRLAQLIGVEPTAQWSVARMAKAVGMSRSALYRRLRDEGVRSPGRLLTRVRLRTAVRLLADARLTIAQVAVRAGFSDQGALTRAMRREMGQTPHALRQTGTMSSGSGILGHE